MLMKYSTGFTTLKKKIAANTVNLEKVVSNVLVSSLISIKEPEMVDARYHKVVYMRNENMYLIIGKGVTEKVTWEDMPASVKTMVNSKAINVTVE